MRFYAITDGVYFYGRNVNYDESDKWINPYPQTLWFNKRAALEFLDCIKNKSMYKMTLEEFELFNVTELNKEV